MAENARMSGLCRRVRRASAAAASRHRVPRNGLVWQIIYRL